MESCGASLFSTSTPLRTPLPFPSAPRYQQHHHHRHRTNLASLLQDTGWRNMLLWMLLLFLFFPSTCFLQQALAEVIYQDYVSWTPPLQIRGYHLFPDSQLLEFTVPEASTQSIWKFQSFSDKASCEVKQVYIFLQYGSFPIINLTNKTFPNTFYLKRTFSERFILRSDNRTTVINMDAPRHGPWFAAALLPNPNEKIQQKGILTKCKYSVRGMLVTQTRKGYGQAVANTIVTTTLMHGFESKMKYYKIVLPPLSYLYYFSVLNCTVDSVDTGGCPIYVSIGNGNMPPFDVDEFLINCTNSTENCHLRVVSPNSSGLNFVAFYLRDINSTAPVTVTWQVTTEECEAKSSHIFMENSTDESMAANKSQVASEFQSKCIILPMLGQFSSASENFNSIYVFPNEFLMPKRNNTLVVPDTHSLITGFNVRFLSNSGGTIGITLHFDKQKLSENQTATIYMCIVKDGFPDVHNLENCSNGALLSIESADDQHHHQRIHIPYPEFGDYYVALISRCYSIERNQTVEPCHTFPTARFTIIQSRCLNEKCGHYGHCAEYISGLFVFSACRCFAGWKGYVCTDDTDANSDSLELLAVMLLTLSNGFFIPAIILAFYRRFYLEGVVYIFTMFFSAVYHACDASNLYQYCMMKYDVLSFSDFLGSYMAVWVTLMAMARLPDKLRTIFDVMGALFLALAVDYDKHSLLLNVVPLVLGIGMVFLSWGYQCRLRHHCYPTWRRYVFCLLPGVLLALVGLLLFTLFETETNYKYVHSIWHVLIATSIVFLLPGRRELPDGSSKEQYCTVANTSDPQDQNSLVIPVE
ncbi:post-GPI attachment to proteins factor 6 isoform X1 [Octopus bimaculoides]|uniref:post-GPI attachment to proteins factor 6 isoform X1 n=2 Tax=Octopus bimaculoides TaxID=37653 RepID=UPI0022E6D1EA|nr:post-GPI attachment to proteins factor 6 isoform X1 [Octopus bimaculoides]XP_052832354.1 post-GPI attachment to proteins factor 6 isoform X1 [Octopus bimaculoides]